jgi:NHLM bacteriocin system ABC transporter ATP-binding protein
MRLRGPEEERQFQERQKRDASLLESTLDALSSIASPGRQPRRSWNASLEDPLVAALHEVAAAQGLSVRDIPTDANGRSQVQIMAQAWGARARTVLLAEGWYHLNAGPMLGFDAMEQPVALLPERRLLSGNRYVLVNPASGERKMVGPEIAASLSPFAFTLYAPLPEQARPAEFIGFALKGRSRDVAIVLLCGLAAALLGMLAPQATAILVEHAIPDANRRLLLELGLALGAAAVGSLLFEIGQAISLLRLEAGWGAAFQAGVWDRLLKLSPAFFRGFSAGDLESRADAVSAIRQQLSGTTLYTLFIGTTGLLSLALMVYYSPILAAAALALTLVAVAVSAFSGVVIVGKIPALQEIEGKLFGLMVQLIDAVPKLRIAGAEERAFAHWGQSYTQTQRLKFSISRLQDRVHLFNVALPMVSSAVIFGVAAIAGFGAGGLSLGRFLAFNAAFGTFVAGAIALSDTGVSLLNVVNLWKRARPIFDEPPEVDIRRSRPVRLTGRVKLDRVTFRYREDGPLTLDEVTIEAQAGQCIALVGPSGSGKSTIINMLLGFEKPRSGAVYYDGHDLDDIDISSVRRQLGVVLQESRIMAGSMFENIISGSNSTIGQAWEAARAAALEDDINEMPMGMHTVVSEGGGNLSGGQRQRLLLARALILKPSILILDEATSALDNRTQAAVTKNLDRLQVTRIVAAHRLSTIRKADRVYVIEAGRVVQEGTFEELSAEDGLFRRLMTRQTA